MNKPLWLLSLLCLAALKSLGQITPPGLEGARVVGWVALGFTQTISPRWSLASYVGTSTQSSLANAVFWEKPAISIINQEVAYQFSSHWQLVLAGSLRTQAIYEEEPPYDPKDPGARYEFRTYARLYYRHRQGKLSWAHSFRPEYRRFYTPDWQDWPKPLQIRLRWKSQLAVPINADQTTQFIAANEILTAIDRTQGAMANEWQWSRYRLTEDRFALFIRHLLPKPGLWVDVGLMNQLWWDTHSQRLRYTAYLSLDLLFRDPFKKQQATK